MANKSPFTLSILNQNDEPAFKIQLLTTANNYASRAMHCMFLLSYLINQFAAQSKTLSTFVPFYFSWVDHCNDFEICSEYSPGGWWHYGLCRDQIHDIEMSLYITRWLESSGLQELLLLDKKGVVWSTLKSSTHDGRYMILWDQGLFLVMQ